MKNLLNRAVVALALVFSANSFAGVITDTVEQEVFVGWYGSHSYTHNLNDDGFVLGSALSGLLTIDIWDDNSWCDDCLGKESIAFIIEDFDFDTGSWKIGTGDFNGGLEAEALLAINTDGYLDVKVKSTWGDFWVGNSTLEVTTAQVPEPSSIALLGFSLIGLSFSRRKYKIR